ncbi:hypothetical protein ANN_07351 [Periplaneta americana]|uniref:Lipocalin/cytosolic fatty-acid binding domain-containing protein n=1 Tax=Periplaneta americana TaxID=6978 RepID=A0ABQ8SZT2_PERAM|nr:hypothetical protein ANN_07351 [Periplaneta americana]
MAQLIGKYQLERNENLDGYFKALDDGCYHASCGDLLNDHIWTIKTSTMIRTTELHIKAGEEYEEVMPSGDVLKTLVHEKSGETAKRYFKRLSQ